MRLLEVLMLTIGSIDAREGAVLRPKPMCVLGSPSMLSTFTYLGISVSIKPLFEEDLQGIPTAVEHMFNHSSNYFPN